MNIRALVLAATCLTLPLAAHAQTVTGPYIGLGAGTSILNSTNFKFDYFGFGPVTGKIQYHPDYAGVVTLGYGFGNGFRVQIDGDYSRNSAAKASGAAFGFQGSAPLSGGQRRYGVMLNALYDIPVQFPITPYVGAGVGYQWEKVERLHDRFGDTISGPASSFAYDVIAGASYNISAVPGLALTGEYRFMQLVQNRGVEYSQGLARLTPKFDLGQESSHTFLLGLRYQLFNPAPAPVAAPAAAPAPVAAPAPAPARTFLVFFDWDKAALTDKATSIIAEAASDSKSSSVTTLDVSGYTDTSGTPTYNQGLSERRATAVAGQLEADGVPASEIEIHAYGETHLLVPTGEGVREPQNRRVEIVLQ